MSQRADAIQMHWFQADNFLATWFRVPISDMTNVKEACILKNYY